MDTGRLIAFLLTSALLYVALMHAVGDWRRNLGRICQLSASSLFGIWLIFGHHLSRPWLVALLLLFFTAILVPFAVQNRLRRLVSTGRTGSLRFWQTLYAVLTWSDRYAVFRNFQGSPIVAYDAGETADTPADKRQDQSTTEILEALIAQQRYAEAVDRFEDEFMALGRRPDAALLYAMSISYAETGDLEQAAAFLSTAEEEGAQRNPGMETRRFMALVRLYALCGRVDDLEHFLARNAALTAAMPPSYISLWKAVAFQRSGQFADAQQFFARAERQIRLGEERLHALIERHRTLWPEGAGVFPLSQQLSAAVDAIRQADATRPVAEAFVPKEHAWATLGLIAAMSAVYLLTELVGSSENTRLLFRLGANVPELVKHGEWWRMVSSMFLHGGALHLLFNAYACYLFGNFVERLTSGWAMFLIFMVAGIAGSAASAMFGSYPVSVGASGGVFGLVGAATVLAVRFKEHFPPRVRSLYVFNFIFIAVINMAFGLMEPRVDNLAHAGGLVAGILVAFLPSAAGSRNRRTSIVHVSGVAACVILAVAAFQAIAYAAAGGYPRRLPPMREYVSAEDAFRISVPVFWEAKERKPGGVFFEDPLGPKLTVFVIQSGARLRLDPGDQLLGREVVRDGARTFEKWKVLTPGPDGRDAQTLLTLRQGKRIFVLSFLCSQRDVAAYDPLFATILESFDTDVSQPRRIRVSRPAAPHPLT